MAEYLKEELKKVVLVQKQQGGGSGSGSGGGGNQSEAKPDVEMYDVGDGEEEEQQQGQDEGEGEGSGEGQGGEEKESKEGEEKDGEEKEGAEGGEGKDEKEGAEKEGADGKGKEGKDGKDGKKGKGQKGGKGKGEGQGDDQGSGGGDTSAMSREQIDQKAKELLDEMEAYNNLPVKPCGSTAKRDEKDKQSDESQASKQTKEEIMREKIKEIMEMAAEDGEGAHPLLNGPRSRGTGKGHGHGGGDAIPIRMRRPDFLDKMKDFADKEYEKEYYRKGTDWFYSQAYSDILFKDRPKVSVPQKYIYLMVDVSGSMFGDFGGTGKSLLEHLIGYLPVIADEYKGEVWWVSDGIITIDGGPGKTQLSMYKEMNEYEQSKYFKKIQEAEGTGGGTTFNVELQAVQDLREKEGHLASIIMLTDSYIDDVRVRYKLDGKEVIGNLPPSTIVMTDTQGCAYLKDKFKKDFDNDALRIECYDITENDKYRMEKRRSW